MSLRGVVAKGDRRKALEAIRDALASELEVAEGATAAALARELRATLADLAALPAQAGGHPIDAIVANVASLDGHRRARSAKAASS